MQISASQTGLASATAGAGAAGPRANDGVNDGFFDSWSIGDTLTDNDKKLVGWDPNSPQVNTLADALSFYRHKGLIKGEVPADFVDALKKSLANKGGYPLDPSLLMTKSEQQSLLSPQTQAALIAMMSGQQL